VAADLRLRPDLRRAAPDIWKSVKAAGCPHFREWVRTVLLAKLSDAEKEHFWSVATMADFRLATLRSEEEILHVLSTDDSLEIALRELAAKVYELRHGDREGAKYLLAVSPPGMAVDIAPAWAVAEASLHTQASAKLARAVRDGRKGPKGKDKGKGKGRGNDH
jgi:hypothetical protein